MFLSRPKLVLDKIIFSGRYLEIRLYKIFEKSGSIEIGP